MKNFEVIASAKSWIEGEAVRQLEATAKLPGMVRAVGLPDLHPGRGNPIGAAFLSTGHLYPYLVGSDIGCGIALFETELSTKKVKRDAWERRLTGLEGTPDEAMLDGDAPTEYRAALGTIGSGNHFAELSKLDEVYDREALASTVGCDESRVQLLVHSGSRGFGAAILRAYVDAHGASPLSAGSEDAVKYLDQHDRAVAWAAYNRRVIARRFAACLSTEIVQRLDACHNRVARRAEGWVHRKGAAPHDAGPVVIAGSRGTPSYLVMPRGDGDRSLWSLAHGAGRKWTRADAKARIRERYSPAELYQTELGSRVICEDRELLYEEAPPAYKSIDQVIDDLVTAGLCTPIARLRPIITYKVRTEGHDGTTVNDD